MVDTPAPGLVLYDFLQVLGGAEKVTLELARGLPGADLCIGFRRRELFPDSLLRDTRCIDLGVAVDAPVLRTLLGLRAFRRRTGFLRDYQWALYSGTNAPVAVHNHPVGRNICYCHTIPRFAYDLEDYYLDTLPRWQRPAFRALVEFVRPRYQSAMEKMDVIVANSGNVRRRIHDYLGLSAEVIHPPVEIESFRWQGQGDYYLSTARLETYKRVDQVVAAFRQMPDKRLVVASGGTASTSLRQLAGGAGNITFTGWMSDEALRDLVGQAIATLYLARDEDFGMSPVESMSAGKPVIGVAEGGLLETVLPGETGQLIAPDPTPEKIIEAVRAMPPERAAVMRSACEQRAGRFTRERFLRHIRSHLEN